MEPAHNGGLADSQFGACQQPPHARVSAGVMQRAEAGSEAAQAGSEGADGAAEANKKSKADLTLSSHKQPLRSYGQRRPKTDPVTDSDAPTLSRDTLSLLAGSGRIRT